MSLREEMRHDRERSEFDLATFRYDFDRTLTKTRGFLIVFGLLVWAIAEYQFDDSDFAGRAVMYVLAGLAGIQLADLIFIWRYERAMKRNYE